MDMYQKRKMRKEGKNNTNQNEFEKTVINWYPGHMKKTKDELKKIMPYIDVVYELIDCRIPYSSKIKDIDEIIKNKIKILIMTKKDLCDIEITNKWKKYYEKKGYNVVLSNLNDSNDYKTIINVTNELIKKINEVRKSKGLKEKEIKSVVLGVPNVGKSSLINKMAGKTVAKTGNLPGVTKNMTWLKTNQKILILDTPGILWPKFDEEKVAFNLASMTSISENVIPLMDIAEYILKMISENYPDIYKERFKHEKYIDNSFELIGKNIGAIKKDEIDYNRVYKYIINEIKLGNIKGITFDRC